MGYTTEFSGQLRFNRDLTAPELVTIKNMLWGDGGDWEDRASEFIHPHGKPGYIQFELTKNMDGIEWDGSEKFYNSVEAVNFIIDNARISIPDFGFTGELKAQGEDFEDRWYLRIGDDGFAKKVYNPIEGNIITCPHCCEIFVLEAA